MERPAGAVLAISARGENKMCLAIVGKIIEIDDQNAIVDVQGNQIETTISLVPDAKTGDCVLLHAGCAIAMVSPDEFTKQQKFFKQLDDHVRKTLQTE